MDDIEGNQYEVRMGVMLPTYNEVYVKSGYHRYFPYFAQMLQPALEIAMKKVANEILPFHNVTYVPVDSQCSVETTQILAVELRYEEHCNVFLGPMCEYPLATVGRFSNHWKVPLITCGGLSAGYSNKVKQWRTLTRMQGSADKFGYSVLGLFRQNHWNRSALFYDATPNDFGILDCYFHMGGVSRIMGFQHIPHEAIEFTTNSIKSHMRRYLTRISLTARGKYQHANHSKQNVPEPGKTNGCKV